MYFKNLISHQMREHFLLNCNEFYTWIRGHLEEKLNQNFTETVFSKLFPALIYIIFNVRFDEIIRTGSFSETQIQEIKEEKENFNMINDPTK
mmetsp:Transcript_12829/g.14431  ORF Transcript_12829/g.14431 Transcript_12829/m.14431 type:complete len:92 (+) Transcript_12829:607-882(+)